MPTERVLLGQITLAYVYIAIITRRSHLLTVGKTAI